MEKSNSKITHILLVEDNEGDVMLTMEAFEDYNVKTEISVARNGQEALQFLHREGYFKDAVKPDLILLDINLPIFNGHEVLEKIKSDPILKIIPVIMLTTSSSNTDLKRAFENHCDGYVQKPLEIKDFIESILKIENFWLQLTTISK